MTCPLNIVKKSFMTWPILFSVKIYYPYECCGVSNFSALIALKVQSCKLYDNKCIIALAQITNTETFTFKAVVVFKLLNHEVLFTNKKDSRNCKWVYRLVFK